MRVCAYVCVHACVCMRACAHAGGMGDYAYVRVDARARVRGKLLGPHTTFRVPLCAVVHVREYYSLCMCETA